MKTLQKLKMAAVGLAVVLAGAVAMPAMAASYGDAGCDASDCSQCDAGIDATKCYTDLAGKGGATEKGLMENLQSILNLVFGLVGFIAVLMLVIGGILYMVSSGDASKVKRAKDTILYGIIGLIVTLLAAAIVNLVLSALK